jgi:hypothetical protein
MKMKSDVDYGGVLAVSNASKVEAALLPCSATFPLPVEFSWRRCTSATFGVACAKEIELKR